MARFFFFSSKIYMQHGWFLFSLVFGLGLGLGSRLGLVRRFLEFSLEVDVSEHRDGLVIGYSLEEANGWAFRHDRYIGR